MTGSPYLTRQGKLGRQYLRNKQKAPNCCALMSEIPLPA